MTRRDLFAVVRELRKDAERGLSGASDKRDALQRIYAVTGAVIVAENAEADARAEAGNEARS